MQRSMQTAGLVAIRERKLLLAFSRNKKAYYLPGGKLQQGEQPMQALIREIREELNIDLGINELSYYMHISAPAFGEESGLVMEQDCFMHELRQEPSACAEITSLKFFNSEDYLLESVQVSGVRMILEHLKAEKIID